MHLGSFLRIRNKIVPHFIFFSTLGLSVVLFSIVLSYMDPTFMQRYKFLRLLDRRYYQSVLIRLYPNFQSFIYVLLHVYVCLVSFRSEFDS